MKNIAIIAHVDHGKTTLIDGLFQQTQVFDDRKESQDRVMDSGELERERGITIKAKNASIVWKDNRINVVDTPGHADFGGEVERALFMVDGALLLVDAAEGPLPQTRFVLKKALEKNLKIIVVINKVDRPDSRIEEIEEKVLELFYDVALNDEQVDYSTIYASAKLGWASLEKDKVGTNFHPLLDKIVEEIPSPKIDDSPDFKMLVTNLSYDNFVGQVATGRIASGSIKSNQNIKVIQEGGKARNFSVTSLACYAGLGVENKDELHAGDIALISGIEGLKIGDTMCAVNVNEALPRLAVDSPTVVTRISVNTSPFAGTEGQYLTSRKLEEQLQKACLNNVALEYAPTDNPEVFLLKARGELQIVIFLEEQRRLGFELMVGRPEIIAEEVDGEKFESEEMLVMDLPESCVGSITELLSNNGGRMESMEKMSASERSRMEFRIPTRGLIGLRSQILTLSRGEAVFASHVVGKIPYQGKRFSRKNGAMVVDRNGVSSQYGLFHLESRGWLFLKGGVKVYEGMIFGEHNRREDLNANATKEKKLSNMRAAGKDESTKLSKIKVMSLDEAFDWIDDDEWLELTPTSIRPRKSVLAANQRKITRYSE